MLSEETVRDTFEVIILTGRPAAGKSEVIDYLKKTPVEERRRRFHIGEFEEIDDFPMIWERFEDEAIYEKYGKPRVYTTPDNYFKEHEPTSLIQRFVTVGEVSDGALFLVQNGAVNGSSLRVEGGIIRSI